MKKIFAALLAMVMVIAMCMPAMAAYEIGTAYSFSDMAEFSLNRYTGTIVCRPSNGASYTLIDSEGNKLTTAPYIVMSANGSGFEIAVSEGLNVRGYMDGQGNQLVSMGYGDILVINEDWQMGVVLETATVDNYDYKNSSGDAFYLVTVYDVYYKGAYVGSLERTAYSSAEAHGAFLYVKDKSDNVSFYDSSFNKSTYTGDGYASIYSEFIYDYKTTVWHPGSNQQAFVPGCTLTSEDVEQDLYFIKGQCLDLQGNVVFDQGAYEGYGKWENGYYKVRGKNDLYGLIDRQGNMVLPCEYDDIFTSQGYFASGYQGVVKGGKFGYVNLNNEVTCPFTYSENAVGSYYSPITKFKDMEGNYIVLTAAGGEMPETYAYVYLYDGCPLAQLEELDGTYSVVDMYGNKVLTGLESSSITIALDGSVVVCYNGSRAYTAYNMIDLAQATASTAVETTPATEETAAEETTTETPAATTPDGTGWLCECGAGNNGNFCTNCGAARPVKEVVCAGCGYKPEGEAPKFCPECGSKF